jgi:ELWxxDGT repeat protein
MSDTAHLKAVLVLPLVLFSFGAAALAQPAFRVKDINTTRSDGIQYPLGPNYFLENLVAMGTAVFLGASDGIHGSELWRTDGTEAGTRLVTDICPGSCASTPQSLTAVGGQIFFLADDGLHGQELWKSDGTAAGTALVKDLIPEGKFAFLTGLTELNGRLLFSYTDYRERHELWGTDGTEAGTVLLASFPTNDTFFAPQPLVRLGGKLFFVGDDGTHGREFWTTDGTAAGTVLLKDIAPGLQGSALGYPEVTVAGGKVLFHAGGPEGFELWASDGTAAGTALVKDINPGLGSVNIQSLTSIGPDAYFFASLGFSGYQLWKSDGTTAGTQLVRGTLSFYPRSVTVARNRLFFLSGCDLWTSNGTAAGTVRVKQIIPDSSPTTCAFLPPPIPRGRLLLFFAGDASHGIEPWKSDGTAAGTGPLADLYPGPGSSVDEIRQGLFFAGRWYFQAKANEDAGPQLWTTDGTAAGTRMLRINRQASGFAINAQGTLTGPRALFDLNGTTLLFQGRSAAAGAELWRSNGTAAGTLLVKDLHPGPGSSFPGELTRAGGTVFFRSDAGTSSEKLWKTNGTRAGTQLLRDVEQFHNFGFFSPRDLTALGNNLLFLGSCCVDTPPQLMRSDGTVSETMPLSTAAGDQLLAGSIVSLGNQILLQAGNAWDELWRSDGTSAGTIPLLSGVLSIERVLADSSAARDGVLLFAGSASGSGEELWQSDGTVAGTHLAAEIVPGAGSKRLGPFATTGPVVFFAAGGDEIWKNDAGGTSLVLALPGNPSVGIRSLTALGGKVYFSYDDGAHGRELWVSDGTPAGTRLFADIQPGAGSSNPRHLHAEGNILLFAASDGVHGIEPWRTDGTAPGTRMIQDIAPGILPSSPVEFTASGPNIYFVANDGTTGFELWALPRAALR